MRHYLQGLHSPKVTVRPPGRGPGLKKETYLPILGVSGAMLVSGICTNLLGLLLGMVMCDPL